MKQLVLVLGAAGQLGDAMTSQLVPRHEVIARSRDELDVTVPDAVRATVGSICPDVIINCAAYTNVDAGAARADPRARHQRLGRPHAGARGRGHRRHARALQHRLRLRRRRRSSVRRRRRRRTRAGTYAVSKLLGEWMAADAPRHYVLRVESLFGGPLGAKQYRSAVSKASWPAEPVKAFADRTVSPSYVNDVVAATAQAPRPTARHPASTTASTAAGRRGRTWRVSWPASSARPTRRSTKSRWPTPHLPTPRPKFAALSNAKLAARASRCRPGRMRSPGTSDRRRRSIRGAGIAGLTISRRADGV